MPLVHLNACSIVSESGRNGKCLKLTNTGAAHDYEKQMEYDLKGKGLTPAKGTRYVIKFWARKVSGSGQIKVLLQKNEPSTYPQQPFNGMNDNNNPFTVSNDWTHYEFDITANKGDYEVIKINFGNCGEVWIDDIEYGEYTDNVARTINVEGKIRKYWLYVPASVAGTQNVPVIFSLHGRQDKGEIGRASCRERV